MSFKTILVIIKNPWCQVQAPFRSRGRHEVYLCGCPTQAWANKENTVRGGGLNGCQVLSKNNVIFEKWIALSWGINLFFFRTQTEFSAHEGSEVISEKLHICALFDKLKQNLLPPPQKKYYQKSHPKLVK